MTMSKSTKKLILVGGGVGALILLGRKVFAGPAVPAHVASPATPAQRLAPTIPSEPVTSWSDAIDKVTGAITGMFTPASASYPTGAQIVAAAKQAGGQTPAQTGAAASSLSGTVFTARGRGRRGSLS